MSTEQSLVTGWMSFYIWCRLRFQFYFLSTSSRQAGFLCANKEHLKSVQSALSDLLTTSATHGTFSRPSTKRGLILIGLELNTNARESFEHC